MDKKVFYGVLLLVAILAGLLGYSINGVRVSLGDAGISIADQAKNEGLGRAAK